MVDFSEKRDRIARYAGYPSWDAMTPAERQNASAQYNAIYNNAGDQTGSYQAYNPWAPAPGQATDSNTVLPNYGAGAVDITTGGGGGGGGTPSSSWIDEFLNNPNLDNPSQWLTDAFADIQAGGDGLGGELPRQSMLEGDWLARMGEPGDEFIAENWADQQRLLGDLNEDLDGILGNLQQLYRQGLDSTADFNQVQDALVRSVTDTSGQIRDEYAQQYKPMIDRMVTEAEGYATPERMREAGGAAASEVARAQEAQREAAMRSLESYGIDPSQTRAQAIDANLRSQQAADAAAAANQEMARVEDTGWQRRQEALQAGIAGQGMLLNAAGLDQAAGGMNLAQLQGNVQAQEALRANLMQRMDINQLKAQYGAQWQQVANMMIDKQIKEMGLELSRRGGIDQYNLGRGNLGLDWARALSADELARLGMQFDWGQLKTREDLTREGYDLSRWQSEGDWENRLAVAELGAQSAEDMQRTGIFADVATDALGIVGGLIPGIAEGGHVEGEAINTGRSSPTMHPLGPAIKLESGGHIVGPGGPKSDAIPAMVSNDEYVIPAEVVKKKGTDFFDNLVTKQKEELDAKRRMGAIAPPQQITDLPAAGPGVKPRQAIPMGAGA